MWTSQHAACLERRDQMAVIHARWSDANQALQPRTSDVSVWDEIRGGRYWCGVRTVNETAKSAHLVQWAKVALSGNVLLLRTAWYPTSSYVTATNPASVCSTASVQSVKGGINLHMENRNVRSAHRGLMRKRPVASFALPVTGASSILGPVVVVPRSAPMASSETPVDTQRDVLRLNRGSRTIAQYRRQWNTWISSFIHAYCLVYSKNG